MTTRARSAMAGYLKSFLCFSCDGLFFNQSNPFTLMDLFLTFLSIGSFLADIGTDAIVIIQYYLHGHMLWMLLTSGLVCIPSVIVQVFSIGWYIIDEAVSHFIWVVHILQLGIFQRYLKLLSLGLKIRHKYSQEDIDAFHQQQSDICMLRLFESFMESAPQLVLQLYIMASTDEWNLWTATSAVASIFSLSWGIAAYSKAMRNVLPEKHRLSWWGLLFQSLWRIGMVSSRIFAMVLFATAYGSWLLLVMIIHWFCMTVWVILQKTDFCNTWWEERLYNGVVGVIYCFCYFNIKEGRSRYRMSIYYSVTITQNIGFLLAFYASENSSEDLIQLIVCLVPVGIVIGLISMLLYYRFFHPSGPIFFSWRTPLMAKDESNTAVVKQCICCTLKTCRKLKEKGNKVPENTHIPPQTSKDIPENTNASDTPMQIVPDSRCVSDLHRSHSLNCSYGSQDMDRVNDFTHKSIHHRKSQAYHYRSVNYHFRSAANDGKLSSKVHCSCLVLMQNFNCKKDCLVPQIQHSKSLPNFEKSFEKDQNIQSSFISCNSEETTLKSAEKSSQNITSDSSIIINNPIISIEL